MQVMVLFGNKLVERGYAEKDGGFYMKMVGAKSSGLRK